MGVGDTGLLGGQLSSPGQPGEGDRRGSGDRGCARSHTCRAGGWGVQAGAWVFSDSRVGAALSCPSPSSSCRTAGDTGG